MMRCRTCDEVGYEMVGANGGRVLEDESTVTYRLGGLVVKRPSSDRVVPGSNAGPVIFKREDLRGVGS